MAKSEYTRNAYAPVCRQCGKRIEGYSDGWAYRRRMKMAGKRSQQWCIFCTWKCLCQAEREADHGVNPDKYDATYQNRLEKDRRRYHRLAEKRKEAQEEANHTCAENGI